MIKAVENLIYEDRLKELSMNSLVKWQLEGCIIGVSKEKNNYLAWYKGCITRSNEMKLRMGKFKQNFKKNSLTV